MADTPDYADATAFNNDVLILQSAFVGGQLASGAHVDVPLSQYASLMLIMNAAVVQVLKLDFHQASTVGGTGDTTEYVEYLTNPDVNITPEWVIPINCGSIRVTNLSAGPVNLIGYGSTRQVARIQPLGFTALPRSFQTTGAATAGTVFVVTAIDGQANSIQMHGQVYIKAGSSNIAAFYGYRYLTQAGVLREIYLGHFAAGQSFFGFISLPSVPVLPVMLPDTTTAATTMAFDFIQLGP